MSGEQQPMLPFGDEPKEKGKAGEEPPAAKEASIEADATMPNFDIEARREHFKDKQERKREGLERAAQRAQEQSEAALEKAHQIGDRIPMGQPILVGHHSEKRHRKDLERIDNAMRKGIEQGKRAEQLAARAEKLGSGGVSADDPDAVQKLTEQLEGLEKRREIMKSVNRQYRKGGWDAVDAITEQLRDKLKADCERLAGHKPFEGFELSNIGANIRRIKQRIESLREEHQREASETLEGEGYEISEDLVTNRVKFVFEGKPDVETRKYLKQNGFRWAPSVGAWQRQLNASGRFAAKRVHTLLEGK